MAPVAFKTFFAFAFGAGFLGDFFFAAMTRTLP
jgi:hypothetical protein